jgi:hypothetical protein
MVTIVLTNSYYCSRFKAEPALPALPNPESGSSIGEPIDGDEDKVPENEELVRGQELMLQKNFSEKHC